METAACSTGRVTWIRQRRGSNSRVAAVVAGREERVALAEPDAAPGLADPVDRVVLAGREADADRGVPAADADRRLRLTIARTGKLFLLRRTPMELRRLLLPVRL